MNTKTIRCLAAAAAIAWAAAQSALAGFRVAEAPPEARSMALMAIQSAGDASGETVETTTPEAPFTVDFSQLGVEDATGAYLMIVNEETGGTVALATEGAGDTELQLTPLVLAELEMQYLGAGSSYLCMAMSGGGADGKDEMLSSARLASSLSTVEFPNFNYRAADGSVQRTTVADRRLVATMESEPQLTMKNPEDAAQQAFRDAFGKANRYMSLAYRLPDGRTAVFEDNEAVKAKLGVPKRSDSRTMAVSGKGTGPAYETAPSNLRFALDLEVVDGTADFNVVKYPNQQGLQIWSDALCGDVPVSISIMMFSFSDIIPLLFDDVEDTDWDSVIGCSWGPPAWQASGFTFVESLLQQLVGFDISEYYDIDLWMNTDMSFYYGTDAKCPANKVDYTTIVLHEVAHGLGFVSSVQPDGTFEYYDDEYWYPMLFDYHLTWNGTSLCKMTTADRYKAVRSGALYFSGPNAVAANAGEPVQMYAPSRWESGSSVSHWDWNVAFPTFMKYAYTKPLHTISPQMLGLMQDIGWTLAVPAPTPPEAPLGVQATQGTLVEEVRASWNPSSGAATYTVERAKGSGAFESVATGLKDCVYTDKNVEAETHYRYRVTAVNAAGSSAPSAEATGWAKAATVLSSIGIEGSATLEAGAGANYSCIAVYSDGSKKDVSDDPGCKWTLPYGSAYATLDGHRLTAGKLTEKQQATIQAEYNDRRVQKSVQILPQTVTVSFDAGAYGKAEFASREYTVGAKYGTLPKVTGVPAGKEFKGWFTSSSGGSEVTASSTVAGTVTKLSAQYVDVDVVSKVWVDAPDTVEWGKTVQAKCFVTLNGTDRQWSGSTRWEISNQGLRYSIVDNVVSVSADDGAAGSISIAATVNGVSSAVKTIRAVAPTATLTLDAQGGTVSPATLAATRGSAIAGLPTPVLDKHDFKGWFTAKTGGTEVKNGTVYDGSYTVLYARWEKKVELASVSISGPVTLVSGASASYSCSAKYTDGTTKDGVAATWGASAGAMDNGQYTAPGVTAETTVRIQASYTSQGVTKDAELAVKVTPKTVKVSFDAAGGKADYADKTYTVGLAYGELPDAAWDKYHGFDGWFTAAGIDGRHVTPDTVADENVTMLVAQWHDIVLLESLAVAGPSSVLPGEAILAQMKCTAKYSDGSSEDVTGQTQWSVAKGSEWIDGDGKAKLVTENMAVTVKAEFGGLSKTFNVTIRPKKVAVAFDAHGGTAEFASREYVVGGTYRPLPKAEKAYNQFLGWFTAEEGGRRVLETATVEEAVSTLHAQWEENPPELAGISLTATPATVAAGGTSLLACTATWNKGGTSSESVLGAAEVEWSVAPESAGSVKDGVFTASRVTEETACTVTASYQGKTADAAIAVQPETVEVAFDANGGTVAEVSRTYVVGKEYGAFPSATPPDAVHHFDGWFTAKDGGVRATESTVCEKSVAALFAHWPEERHLTGVRVEGPASVISGESAEFACFGLYSDGTEVGAKPDSWSAGPASAGSISQDGVFTAALVPATAAATVTASLEGLTGSAGITVEPLTVSVRFDPCDGAVSPERKSFVVGSPYGGLPVPNRARYDFDGWFTRPAKAGDKVDAGTVAAADVTVLYAGWTPTPTTLTGIRISGPETVRSGGVAVYACKAVYADGSEGSVVPVWSLVSGLDYASLSLTGFFTAVETDTARKVTIQAVYTDKGVRYEDRLEVAITPAELVVDPAVLTLESGAQDAEIQIDSFGEWTVSADVPWIVLSKTAGSGFDTVAFSVPANPDAVERTGTITVAGSGLEAKCVVKQYSAVPEEYVAVTLDPAIPGLEPSQRQYVKGRKFGFLPQPVRQGYFFGGWWTGAGGTGTRIHALSIVGDDTLSLFGFWQDMDVAHALNNALDWVEDPAHPWVFDYMDSVDRKVSMAAPSLANRESASLTVLVEGPGTVSFYWKASSEEFFDTLSLYVDGRFAASTSGDTPWQAMSRAVSGFGQHVLTWTYAKDGQGASGMDCAWLDLVTWLPDYAGAGASSIQSADGRAVPETWLNAYGLDTGADSLDEDADGDGMTNFEEFVAGTDPTDPDSVLLVYLDMDGEGRPVIGSVPPAGASGNRTYVIEGKASMDEGDWEEADETVHRFFRVRAVAP